MSVTYPIRPPSSSGLKSLPSTGATPSTEK